MQTSIIGRRYVDCFVMNQLYSNKDEAEVFSDVSNNEFDELLCLYPQKARIIKSCKYFKGKLFAWLVDQDISYSTAKPEYFTAEQLILAVSQMGYILGGLIIKDDYYSNVDSSFYKTFLMKISDLECYYTRISMALKKKIIKGNDNLIEMRINKVNYYPTNKRMFAELAVKVGESFSAEIHLITT